jgi:hypothetical protein
MYEYGAIGTMSSVWCGVGLEPDPSRCRIPEVERRMEGAEECLLTLTTPLSRTISTLLYFISFDFA